MAVLGNWGAAYKLAEKKKFQQALATLNDRSGLAMMKLADRGGPCCNPGLWTSIAQPEFLCLLRWNQAGSR